MVNIERFKEDVSRAFSDVHAPERPLTDHECEECLSLQEGFAGKSWKEVSPELIRGHYSDLPLFSAGAFHAFIAAFLIYSLENFDDDNLVSEFTAYAFLPDKRAVEDEEHENWWKLKLSLFSDEQFELVLKYLDLVHEHDKYFDRALMARGKERLKELRRRSREND